MKANFCLVLLSLTLFTACKKQAAVKLPASYLEYLDEKQILGITAVKNDVWVLSSSKCDTCSVSPYVSSIPLNFQLTKITGNSYTVDENTSVMKPVKDRHNNIYAKGKNLKGIYKINGINNYSLVVETPDFMINDFVFDNDNNIWIWATSGIAFWNGNSMKYYNSSNSILPTHIIHGITVDTANIAWAPLDYAGKGIARIENGNISIIPITDIPGLTTNQYLTSPVADNAGNIWFSTMAAATSTIVRYDGQNWTTGTPNAGAYIIGKDQKGTVWQTLSNNNTAQGPTSLYSFNNNEWLQFNTGTTNSYIYQVDVTDNNTFIGTSRGLLVK